MKKFKNNMECGLFYALLILFYGMLFDVFNEFNILGKVTIISVSVVVSFYWVNKRKQYLEEVIMFFIFPIILSQICYNITSMFCEISNTWELILDLVTIPISNFVYSYIAIKRNELTLIELSHLVTFIRCALFVSTIIGFILKNPFFLDGFLNEINVEFIDVNLKIKLSDYINIMMQSVFIPYLISATFIKGYIEFTNFKSKYVNRKNNLHI